MDTIEELFREYIHQRLLQNTLTITCGLPAAGKSLAAKMIKKAKGTEILRSDFIRRELLKDQDIFSKETASDMNLRLKIYEEMFQRAENFAKEGSGIILDATFIKHDLRVRAAKIAEKHHLNFLLLEVVAQEDVCLSRIKNRTKEISTSNAITEDAYFNNKKDYEPIDIDRIKKEVPKVYGTYIVVDTSEDVPKTWSILKKIEF